MYDTTSTLPFQIEGFTGGWRGLCWLASFWVPIWVWVVVVALPLAGPATNRSVVILFRLDLLGGGLGDWVRATVLIGILLAPLDFRFERWPGCG